MGTTKLNIGKIPISKGEYQEGTTYQRLNQVTMLGSTYQSKIDDNTSAPAQMGADGAVENINTDKWLCIAVGNVSAAKKVVYNNETSGLEAGNVQEAIDEVGSKVSDLGLLLTSTGVKNIPITVKAGDIIEVSVKGNTTRKQFSLLQDSAVQEKDVIKFLDGSNGTKYYVATKDANVMTIFSDIAETISVRINVVEHFFTTKKELASITSETALAEFQYAGFLMTGFYNDVMRLRVFSSYDGIHFDEFVKDNDIVLNNINHLRDPDLVKNGDWYYISITGFPIYIYKTKDFKNFELHAKINPKIEERTSYWAPEIFKDISGKIYMIFAAYRDKKEGEQIYNVQTYICELNADFNSLVGTPTKLTMPTHEEGYNFDLSIMYDTDKRKYYACDFGNNTLSIFESEIISAEYKIKVQMPLINSDYYEGATIIKRGGFYYVYVTCKYDGWDLAKTKAICVYIFNKDWVFITFKYCHIADDYPQYDINPSSEGTGNIIISEHAKILPLKSRDFNKLEL